MPIACSATPKVGEVWLAANGQQRRAVLELQGDHVDRPTSVAFQDQDGQVRTEAMESWSIWVTGWRASPAGTASQCPACGGKMPR